jgi:hypothetical protein
VLARLLVARDLGPEVDFGVCAFLTHLASVNALGFVVGDDVNDKAAR